MAHAYLMCEFWTDGQVGREVALDAVRAADAWIAPESVHLTHGGESKACGEGECEVGLTFTLRAGATVHDVWDAVRGAGIRAKEACEIPEELAGADVSRIWDYQCSE